MTLFRGLVFLLAGGAWTVFSQAIPPEMREALVSEFQFSAADLAKAENGVAVARMVPTGKPDDVRLAGIVRIDIPAAEFMRAFRDIEHFQFSKESLQTGRFSTPPIEADVAAFHTPDLKKDDLLACRPGACAYKMPASAMEDLRTKIDWKAPDAQAKAEAMIKQLWVARLNDYQKRGDGALAVYYDSQAPYSVAEGLHSLLGGETRLSSSFPDLLHYAADYPKSKPAGAEDFFYWQEAAFGLKHVVRLQHVIIQPIQRPSSPELHYAIISKMLFASHYFRAAIEFNYVYPTRTASGKPAVYFFSAQRSYVDGMTGFKGSIVRRVAEGRSPSTMVNNLELAKKYLERGQ